jgi:hypothetical protein
MKVHLCDDSFYQAAPSLSAIFMSEQSALAYVKEYEEDCKQRFRDNADARRITIDGKQYRRMDLEYVGDNTYKYAPKTEYDYEDLWEKFPRVFVQEVTVKP